MFTVFSWFGLVHAYAANVERLVPNAWATATLSLNYISFIFFDVLFSVLVNDQVGLDIFSQNSVRLYYVHAI